MTNDGPSERSIWRKEFKYGTLQRGEGIDFFTGLLDNLPRGYVEVKRLHVQPHLMPLTAEELQDKDIYSFILPTRKAGMAEFCLYQEVGDLSPNKLFGMLSVHGATIGARDEIRSDLLEVLEKLSGA